MRVTFRICTLLFTACTALAPAMASAEDIVLRWNRIAAQTATTSNAFGQARAGAIVQLAVFEAVNAVTGEYESYLQPGLVAPGASVEAAVIVAAHDTLVAYFPAAAPTLDATRDSDLASIADTQAKTDGIALGMAAASAMIALRTGDGAAPPATFTPISTAAGDYQLTTNCVAALNYQWQNVTPFGVASAWDFLLDPPPPLGSNRYRKDYQEVQAVGSLASTSRPPDRAEVVRFYNSSSSSLLLTSALRQMAVARGTSLAQNARALALLQMAISDAFVASFLNKYHYNRWRPETGIRKGADDGDDRTEDEDGFTTFIGTPCFPSYPSNHASGTSSGLEVLRRLFGAAGHDLTLTSNVPALGSLPAAVITKHYTQLGAIADDVDDARVYGGIHWRYDQVAGRALGRAIAATVVKNNLQPVRP
jgi:membrane-associated phospholipid phosphatase